MINGEDYKFIENKNSDTLIVSFNYHNGNNNFFKFGALTKLKEYNLLFLTSKNKWYLEDDGKGTKFKNFLNPFIKKYGPENTLFFGSSMGGSGALIHGIYFGVNVFTSNPQIDEKIVFKHIIPEKKNFANSLLKNNIKLLEIKELYKDKHHEPIIYFLCGNTPADSENLIKFLSYVPPKIKIIIEKLPTNEHDYWTHSNQDIFCRLDIMNKIRKVTYSKYK